MRKCPLALLCLAACTSVSGYPDAVVDRKGELKALRPYLKADVATSRPSGKDAKDWRNEVVFGRVRAVDLQFMEFERELHREGVGWGIGTDWTVLALNTTGALVPGSAQALSAVSAMITGGKAAFDKRALFERTIPTLLAAMVAKRKAKLVEIQAQLGKPVDQYPITAALSDVDDYYRAGTIPAALTELANTAAEENRKATRALNLLKGIPDFKERTPDFQSTLEAAVREIWKLDDLDEVNEVLTALSLTAQEDIASARAELAGHVGSFNTREEYDAALAVIRTTFAGFAGGQ